MSYTVIIDQAALAEYKNAALYYEEHQSGLGSRFMGAVTETLNIISQNPQLFTQRKRNYREALTKKFPFLIVYATNKATKTVTVVSVFHTSRDPKKKYKKRK